MPRHIQVLSFCENHPDVPAMAEHVGRPERGKPRLVDVCEMCLKGIVEPYLALLALGTPLEQVTARPRVKKVEAEAAEETDKDRTCPLCGKVSRTRSALGQHLTATHQTRFTALREEGYDI